MPKIKFTIITLFREALEPYLNTSMMWKAKEKGIVEFDFVNLRDFGLGPHKSVDDTPYGGGDGMLLRCEPVFAAIESVKTENSKVILPTPVGKTWTQKLARELAGMPESSFEHNKENSQVFRDDLKGEQSVAGATRTALRASPSVVEKNMTGFSSAKKKLSDIPIHYIILCPHYEGYDERILSLVDYKISLGHYVLTGGELPALIIIDSITRLLPGVLGGETSAVIESFSDGNNLEYPQYTKPADFRGMKVPDVLLSGNHGEIAKWRKEHSGDAEE